MGRAPLLPLVEQAVEALLREGQPITTGTVSKRAKVAPQTAFTHLSRLADNGVLAREGSGRASHFLPKHAAVFRFPLAGLEEDRVLLFVRERSPLLAKDHLAEAPSLIFDWLLTEMVNNAIDHSGGKEVAISLSTTPSHLVVDIEDDGEGIFRHIQNGRNLASELEAIGELSKGKTTTAPERHTGQGIFFSARAVDRFCAESGVLRWCVDSTIDDTATFDTPERKGTLIHAEIGLATKRDLKTVFDEYSDESLAFSKTSTWVRLFETKLSFLSRSEAKRLMANLDRFAQVTLDFKGVTGIGQGFADEIFRVWAKAHPQTKLISVNMGPAVSFMVKRATG